MAVTVHKNQVALVKALDALKTLQGVHWTQIAEGLRTLLSPEMQHIVRCPPQLLPTAQGRAQIADDILRLIDTCSELAAELRRQEAILAPKMGAQPVYPQVN